jgi:hypothetical protein
MSHHPGGIAGAVVATSPNRKQAVGFAAKGYMAAMRNDAGTWTAIRATIADAN